MTVEIILFYLSAFVAVAATMLTVTRTYASHALIYLIVSLLAVAVIFFLLGAPFAAALEVVIYAGAIMVFFLFVVMMLNLGPDTRERERRWLAPRTWIGPGVLAGFLFLELIYLIAGSRRGHSGRRGGAESGGHRTVRALPAGRGTGFHTAACGAGGGLPPRAPVHAGPAGGSRMTAVSIPIEHVLVLAGVLFAIGLAGVLVRRNVIFLLMSLEIMMNACGLAFVAAGARWAEADGQVMFMLILSLAAAEVAVGLGLVLQLERRFRNLDIDAASELAG